MNPPHDRAWRFVHPDWEVDRGEAGLRISARGSIDMVEGKDSVRQAILLLISTIPGERVMRPEYGCHLHRIVFAPNDESAAGLAMHYVRQALERWEPRIEILDLDAQRNPERAEVLDIFLQYRVRAAQRIDELVLSVNMAGAER